MKLNTLKTVEQVSFKKRFKLYNKLLKLNYGNAALFLYRETRFEPVYFTIFRKWLKIYLKFNKYPFLKNAIWINLYYNYPMSKKSKNARMGKGKGGFFRWSIKLPQNHVVVELRNLNSSRAIFLLNRLRYKLHFLNFYIK